jgi:uncharacterized BrkB/YihY/UPF0761 family membrane protein
MRGGNGHGPVRAVKDRGTGNVAKDVYERFRDSDGPSHSRALAYQSVFVAISGFIGLVGLASVLDVEALRGTVTEMSKTVAPGPASELLEEAASQGSSGGARAMILGLGSALFGGMFAMAQVERSANRMAGRSEDRPGLGRYLTAMALALSAGILLVLGVLVLGGGQAIARGSGWGDSVVSVWAIVRWPVGILLTAIGVFLLFRTAPRERIAQTRALVTGSLTAVALWVVFTVGLAIYFAVGEGAETYGSLITFIALLLWSGATSTALHIGLAVSAALSTGTSGEGTVSIPDSEELRRTQGGRR